MVKLNTVVVAAALFAALVLGLLAASVDGLSWLEAGGTIAAVALAWYAGKVSEQRLL